MVNRVDYRVTQTKRAVLGVHIPGQKGALNVILVQCVESAAISIFEVELVELTNTVFVNSTNITTNIETAVLSSLESLYGDFLYIAV